MATIKWAGSMSVISIPVSYTHLDVYKRQVPELADVAKADLTTEMVLTRSESSRTVGSINTEGRPVVVVHEVVDKYYELRLVYKEQHLSLIHI